MKSRIIFLGAALIAMSSIPASAALIAQFNQENIPSAGTGPVPASDWADNVQQPSSLATFGTVNRRAGASNLRYRGWSTTVDLNNYVGTSISAEPGFQLNLTDFTFSTAAFPNEGSTIFEITSFVWGMRVDDNKDGVFEGGWTFDQTYVSGSPGFTEPLVQKTWDFADFSTTGTVELGLFVASPTTALHIEGYKLPLELNGTVTAVPEPSAALLGALGALALVRRRR